jgi:hypothetical protein
LKLIRSERHGVYVDQNCNNIEKKQWYASGNWAGESLGVFQFANKSDECRKLGLAQFVLKRRHLILATLPLHNNPGDIG